MVNAIYLVLVILTSSYQGGVAIENTQIPQMSMSQCQDNAKKFNDKVISRMERGVVVKAKAYCIAGVK